MFSILLIFCYPLSFVKHGLYGFDKVFTMLLPCFRGFETCLSNCFFIFWGYVLNDFLNQYNIVANVTKLQNFTQYSWMFEGKLMLTLKLSNNTQTLLGGALQ
jgi:hypothetical protein